MKISDSLASRLGTGTPTQPQKNLLSMVFFTCSVSWDLGIAELSSETRETLSNNLWEQMLRRDSY